MNGDEIGALHGIFERDELDAHLLGARWSHVRVVADQSGTETSQAFGNEATDSAETDDCDGFFIQLDAGELRALPLAGF